MLPDTSNSEKMARIGRMTVLRKARREAGQQLRDCLLPMLNGAEESHWDVSQIIGLVEQINSINKALSEL